jgi:Transposase
VSGLLSRALGRCIGLDVHLDFIEIAICEESKVYSPGRVPSTPEGIGTLIDSLLPTDRVALEVTGSSREIARLLEPHVKKVIVVSPGDTGISQARAKTDRLDARTLAKLLWTGELEAVWMPPEWIARMRRRLARRDQRVRARSRVKNELHAVLMRCLKGRPLRGTVAKLLFADARETWAVRLLGRQLHTLKPPKPHVLAPPKPCEPSCGLRQRTPSSLPTKTSTCEARNHRAFTSTRYSMSKRTGFVAVYAPRKVRPREAQRAGGHNARSQLDQLRVRSSMGMCGMLGTGQAGRKARTGTCANTRAGPIQDLARVLLFANCAPLDLRSACKIRASDLAGAGVCAGLEPPPATDDLGKGGGGLGGDARSVVEIVPSDSEDLHDSIREAPTVPRSSGRVRTDCCFRRRSGTSAISLAVSCGNRPRGRRR